jgi:hypothetical protein
VLELPVVIQLSVGRCCLWPAEVYARDRAQVSPDIVDHRHSIAHTLEE